jgi:2-dehydro-3-deoxyphosphogluconate aldolase/(4S)-4-hydroxy-2-oxoglutarate aldolase
MHWTFEDLVAPRPSVDDVVATAPVIPVVGVDDPEAGVELAGALVAGGLPVLEVPSRTAASATVIERIAQEVPDAVVGAGAIVSQRQADDARAAGARFLASAGSTPLLLDVLQTSGLPFLAGVATASEVIALLERDVSVAKLFPAELAGGCDLLSAFAAAFPQMRFCPAGGIDQQLARAYLALPNVVCVGGSWMLPASALRERDYAGIQALAHAAASLGRGAPRPVAVV